MFSLGGNTFKKLYFVAAFWQSQWRHQIWKSLCNPWRGPFHRPWHSFWACQILPWGRGDVSVVGWRPRRHEHPRHIPVRKGFVFHPLFEPCLRAAAEPLSPQPHATPYESFWHIILQHLKCVECLKIGVSVRSDENRHFHGTSKTSKKDFV